MNHPELHLTTEQIELWALGILGAERALHLADCSLCREIAERERKVILALVQLPHYGPAAGFADRVMAQVKVPTPSGDWEGR
jgi:hypothetical protein